MLSEDSARALRTNQRLSLAIDVVVTVWFGSWIMVRHSVWFFLVLVIALSVVFLWRVAKFQPKSVAAAAWNPWRKAGLVVLGLVFMYVVPAYPWWGAVLVILSVIEISQSVSARRALKRLSVAG